jgi:spoIIIJ-associated protein
MALSETQPESSPEGAPDIGKRAHEFLAGVLERMEIQAEISVTELDDKIVLDIDCENVERVIGRRGQVVDALQHLVGKVVSRGRTGRRGKPVVVDAGGYRARHIERLQQLAQRMSEKALKKQSSVSLNPMTPHDRRIVHMQVAEITGVATRSEGTGERRHVVIFPEEGESTPRQRPPRRRGREPREPEAEDAPKDASAAPSEE